MSQGKRKAVFEGRRDTMCSSTSNKEDTLTTRLPRAAKKRKKSTESTNTNNTNQKIVKTSTQALPLPVMGRERELTKSSVTRHKRHAWSSVSITAFFEGLYEHGKSFERILGFMQNKYKKKTPDSFITNLGKNHVRFFYYRTWHKVSTLLSKAQREIEQEAQSPSKSKSTCNSKKNKVNSNQSQSEDEEETEGEIMEGDGPFDTSLDEGEEQVIQSQLEEESCDLLSSIVDTSPYNPSSVEAEQDYDDKEPPSTAPPTNSPSNEVPPVSNEAPPLSNERGKGSDKRKESMIMANGGWYSLDLVAVICYSKLKQKYRGDSALFGKKLFELVYRGSTMIRIKGKRKIHHCKLKVPNCPALRPFKTTTASVVGGDNNRLEDPPESTDQLSTLPITLELRPLNSLTWQYLQLLSINPRLRLTTPPSRTLGDLFDFIATKWHLSVFDIFDTLTLYKTDEMILSENQSPDRVMNDNLLAVVPTMTVRELKNIASSSSDHQLVHLQYNIRLDTTNIERSSSTDVASLSSLFDFIQSSNITGSCPSSPPPLTSSSPPPLLSSLPSTSVPLSSSCLSPSISSLPLSSPLIASSIPLSSPLPSSSLPLSSPGLLPSSSLPLSSPLLPSSSPLPLSSPLPTSSLPLSSPLLLLSSSLPTLSTITTTTTTDHNNKTPITNSSSINKTLTLQTTPTIWSTTSATTPQTPVQIPLFPLERKAATMPSSKPTVISSPKVREYWQELSKKSPMRNIIKSPLSKYRKLQLNKLSPLKISPHKTCPRVSKGPPSSRIRTVKRTRLSFPDINNLSPTTCRAPSTSTYNSVSTSNEICTTTHLDVQESDSSVKLLSKTKGLGAADGSQLKEKDFSMVRLNFKQSSGQRKGEEKLHHLVTVPKQAFATGSFSTFRLTDLFQSVQDNLKATQPLAPPTDTPTSGTSKGAPLTECIPPESLKDAINATKKPITEPSPLELYASQVAASANQPKSQSHNVSIKCISTSPVPTSSSSSHVITPPSRHLFDKKFVRKRVTSNSLLRQRPVIPKPLHYLPHMSSTHLTTSSSPPSTSLPLARPLQFNSFSSSSLSPTAASTGMITSLNNTLTNNITSLHTLSNSSIRPPSLNVTQSSLVNNSIKSSLPPTTTTTTTTVAPTTAPTGITSQQCIQEQMTSLLLTMLLSQQQQSKLSLAQQQELQSVLNSFSVPAATQPIVTTAPSLNLPSYSSNMSSMTHQSSLPTNTMVTQQTFNQTDIQPITSSVNIEPLYQLSPPPAPLPSAVVSGGIPDIGHNNMYASDTVNELLKGLTSSDSEQASLQKLSEETVDVLPTFARAIMQMSSSSKSGEREEHQNNEIIPEPPVSSSSTSNIISDNSLFQLLQSADEPQLVSGTTLPSFSDSNLKQIIDNTDFNDMFSQLRDALKTPDKKKPPTRAGSSTSNTTSCHNSSSSNELLGMMTSGGDRKEEGDGKIISQQIEQDNSNGELLDLFNSPFKSKSSSNSTGQSSLVAARSLIEENSVDYINKFKELASAMSKSQTHNNN